MLAADQVLDAKEVRAPVVVMGTSWGGFVAPRVALRAPERVRGIVTFNTSAEPALPMQRLNAHILVPMLRIAALDGFADRILLSSMLAPETRQQRPQIGTDLIARLRSWDRERMVTTVQSVLLDRDGILDALPYAFGQHRRSELPGRFDAVGVSELRQAA